MDATTAETPPLEELLRSLRIAEIDSRTLLRYQTADRLRFLASHLPALMAASKERDAVRDAFMSGAAAYGPTGLSYENLLVEANRRYPPLAQGERTNG